MPAASGGYLGRYMVPATADIVDAASFPVGRVEWTVVDGVATLHHDLPVGLIGGTIDLRFSGSLAPAATSIDLTGPNGVATCVAVGTVVTCREELSNLGTLPISAAVVQEIAACEYAGPVACRVAVARLFSSDPIGRVKFDLARSVVDGRGCASGSL